MPQLPSASLSPFAGLQAARLVAALDAHFAGTLALISSFGAEAAVLLHMAAQVNRNIPVIFLDTGKHFWQTRYYRAKLVEQLGLTDIRIIGPDAAAIAREDADGTLSTRNADACCNLRKVRPLETALAGFDAVLSGRKRQHGAGRETLQAVSLDSAGRVKAEPLAEFSAANIQNYFKAHDLPPHPLVEHGFRSIGCMDCTARGGTDEDPRAGRWAGQEKFECGIHLNAHGQLVRTNTSEMN